MADTTTNPRIVPGAPPPAPLSKSQKKKRKSVVKPKAADAPSAESTSVIPDAKMAALVEKAPEEEDIKKATVAEELIVPQEHVSETVQDKSKKPSPAVELLNKRIKVQTKKLSRIAVYSSKPPSELNEDQLKSVATLPSIQGAVRELEETRKAVEALEAEQAKQLANQRAEEEKATIDRISLAVLENTHLHQRRLSQILTILHLSSLLSAADPTTFSLVIDEKERQAFYAVATILLGAESPKKEEVMDGLFSGQGNINDVDYSRLLDLVETHRNPPAEREPTPTPETLLPEPDTQVIPAEQESIDTAPAEPPVPGVGDSMLPLTSSGSFHFMQESELETTPFEHSAEWVEKPEESEIVIAPSVEPAAENPTVIDTGIPLGVNGLSVEEPPLSAVSAALDWAADDADGLPSINSLHAKFGTPGDVTPEATPAAPPASVEAEWSKKQSETWVDAFPGTTTAGGSLAEGVESSGAGLNSAQVDEEGFVKAKGSRGRNSEQQFRGGEQRGWNKGGFRGDRGGSRTERGGEHRGGYRGRGGAGDVFGGGWRGGDGELRGRGGFRGDRARGGDFRGRGGRGGEFRGRGRGDRGGYRGRGGPDGNVEQSEKQPNP